MKKYYFISDYLNLEVNRMSRVSNALKMYMLLQGRSIIQVKEIAEILEVSPRMVQVYKNDLEKAGIYVGSKRGRYGGYYLENRLDLRGLGINKKEIEALKMATETIKNGNYPYSIDFETLSSKLINATRDFNFTSYYNKPIFRHKDMSEIEKRIWKDINKAITKKKKIKMNYVSIGKEKRRTRLRVVHPYGTFDYEGATYFYGYCELRKNFRFFKLSRINDYEILDDSFTVNIKYDIKEIMEKSFGIYDDEPINLILKIQYPMSQIVKERQYAVEQVIEEVDESTIILKARMKGYKEIKAWIMSMGSMAEVIKPEKLRKEILNEAKEMVKLYR